MIGHLGNKYKAFRASKTAAIAIRSGEVTSFKTNLKDRVHTAWTDIKTKAGDVKVRVGEGFDNFKNRVSNVKNSLDVHIENSQSHLDDLYTGAKTKVQQFNQSIAESISQISQPNLSMAGMSHSSSELKNVMSEIDQINFHRAYKQAEFEGNIGSSYGSRSISKPGVETFTNWDEVKLAHRGDLVREIHSKKPKGSPAIKKWFNKGGSIEIETLHDGKQIWSYKSADGTTIPYVQKTLENGLDVHVPDFSEYLHPNKKISEIKLNQFSGNRTKDTNLFLESTGLSEIPRGYVVHHSEPNGTLQLVKKDIHELFKHYGGYSWYK